ncbi:MAG: hypothetical protein R2856_11400 [Caldilineaceae bacterium]
MARWSRDTDGAWAPYWYDAVWASTDTPSAPKMTNPFTRQAARRSE